MFFLIRVDVQKMQRAKTILVRQFSYFSHGFRMKNLALHVLCKMSRSAAGQFHLVLPVDLVWQSPAAQARVTHERKISRGLFCACARKIYA
jgi:hypothetical protein